MNAASDDGFVLGIDFGGTKVALRTSLRSAVPLESAVLPTRAEHGTEQVVRRTLDRARRLISATERSSGGRLRAVAAVSPGVVLPDRILLAPNVPGWGGLDLARTLREGLGVSRVAVGTDAKAGALAESRWGALAGVSCGIFLNLGTGIAAAAVADGQVLEGAHGAAGEIGYSLLEPGQAGFAVGRAPLEEQVSGSGIALQVGSLLGRSVTAAEAFVLAEQDPAVRAVLERSLALLGQHVANLAIALDPAVIAVAGGVAENDLVTVRIAEALAAAVPFPPELVAATFGTEAPLVGALALAIDAL